MRFVKLDSTVDVGNVKYVDHGLNITVVTIFFPMKYMKWLVLYGNVPYISGRSLLDVTNVQKITVIKVYHQVFSMLLDICQSLVISES